MGKALYRPGEIVGFRATADIMAGQVVEVTGSFAVAPASAGSVKAVGVALMTVSAGEMVSVVLGRPLVLVTASDVVNAGDVLAAADGGKVAVLDTDTGSAFARIGIAVEDGADGDALYMVLG